MSDRELYEMVNRMANVLKSHGVKKGDVVCIYMPVSPLAVAAMLACARIGSPHRSVAIIITIFLIEICKKDIISSFSLAMKKQFLNVVLWIKIFMCFELIFDF